MMKKIVILTSASVVLLLAVSFVFAMPFKNENPLNEEHKMLVEEAITARDYDAFVALHENCAMEGRAKVGINSENFELFAEMREALVSGDYETARQLKEELGIELGNQKLQRNFEQKQVRMEQRIERSENLQKGTMQGERMQRQLRLQKQQMLLQQENA